jgi:hypothetical protein
VSDQGADAAGNDAARSRRSQGHRQRAPGGDDAERRSRRPDVGQNAGGARQGDGDVLARQERAARNLRHVGQLLHGGVDAAELLRDGIEAGHQTDVGPIEARAQQSVHGCLELVARPQHARHLAHLDPLLRHIV